MEILQIKNLRFGYPDGAAVLDGIDLSVHEGAFVVLAGPSGCGKTTLLRLIKPELAPNGKQAGEIRAFERDTPPTASEIGMVMQDPETGIVTDMVWHELVFGLENMGLSQGEIRVRAGEVSNYFGIQELFHRDTPTLSGGQKQLLSLAAAVAMRPRLLLLDEPTSRLDPLAAASFLQSLRKLNQETGMTIIIAEHRLDDVFPMADRAVFLDGGKVVYDGKPDMAYGKDLGRMERALPTPMRIFSALDGAGTSPLTIAEGRAFLRDAAAGCSARITRKAPETDGETALEVKKVWFRYERELPDVLRGANMQVKKGEIYAVLGANGSGKTTLLSVLAGLQKPYRGKVLVAGEPIGDIGKKELYRSRLSLLPQNPENVFVKETLRLDFEHLLTKTKSGGKGDIEEMAEKMGISHLLDRHPSDLSGGEKQKTALAKFLLRKPDILLLDEPTKGLDAFVKEELAECFRTLRDQGKTLVIVTHDVDFAADVADTCGLFFDGDLISQEAAGDFFAASAYYTTAARRMSAGIFENAVTEKEVITLCKSGQKGGSATASSQSAFRD